MPVRTGASQRTALLALALVSVAGLPVVPAGAQDRPDVETLRALSERGRQIASYVEAVTRARAALARQKEGVAPPDSVVAIEQRDDWRVSFLREPKSAAPGLPRPGTVIVAEADYSPAAQEIGPLTIPAPPRPAPAATVSYARALGVAEAAAEARRPVVARPPYEEAVVREKDGTFTVYLKSTPATASKVLAGADLAARVAATGRQVISVETLHGEETALPLPEHSGGQPTLHTHTTGDLPAPTDVALVLLHPSLAPHLVMTPHCIFRIDSEGTITYLGANQAPAGPQERGP